MEYLSRQQWHSPFRALSRAGPRRVALSRGSGKPVAAGHPPTYPPLTAPGRQSGERAAPASSGRLPPAIASGAIGCRVDCCEQPLPPRSQEGPGLKAFGGACRCAEPVAPRPGAEQAAPPPPRLPGKSSAL